MHSRYDASTQTAAFASRFAHPVARRPGPSSRTSGACTRVVDPASYQALLCNLGLDPDPRLCVPAVHR